MKNRSGIIGIAFTAMLTMANNCTFAQETAPQCKPHELTIGVIGGPNLSTLYAGSTDRNKNYNFGIGYNLGLASSYALNNSFAVVAEVSFAKLSSERKDVQPLLVNSPLQTTSYPLYASFSKKETFDYIDVPLMMRVTAGNKIRVYANAGPYIGFIANASVVTSGRSQLYKDLAGKVPETADNSMYSFDGNQTVTNTINTVTFGLTGGGGIGYAFGKHSVYFDARYEIGLTDIRANTNENGKNNLQSIMVGIGYSYVLFK